MNEFREFAELKSCIEEGTLILRQSGESQKRVLIKLLDKISSLQKENKNLKDTLKEKEETLEFIIKELDLQIVKCEEEGCEKFCVEQGWETTPKFFFCYYNHWVQGRSPTCSKVFCFEHKHRLSEDSSKCEDCIRKEKARSEKK